MSDIEITVEKQISYLEDMVARMDKLNEELPELAGSGHLNEALSILKSEIAICNLHLQRTYVLISAIHDTVYPKETGFERTGGDFVGAVTPTD